jgi:hypothetical protein
VYWVCLPVKDTKKLTSPFKVKLPIMSDPEFRAAIFLSNSSNSLSNSCPATAATTGSGEDS